MVQVLKVVSDSISSETNILEKISKVSQVHITKGWVSVQVKHR